MKNLQKYANECVKDIKALGIDVPNIEKFVINKRAKKRFGQCVYNSKKKSYSININIDLLDDECPEKALKETLYHEIIHTLPNCMNHGKEFQKYARMVNKKYNVNVKRCSSYKEKYGAEYGKKVADRVETKRNYKYYEIICPSCNRVVASGKYQRAPKWYAHPDFYKCVRCGCKNLEINGIIKY